MNIEYGLVIDYDYIWSIELLIVVEVHQCMDQWVFNNNIGRNFQGQCLLAWLLLEKNPLQWGT